MKLGILLIIILSCSFGYSQNLNLDSINSYSLYHIYEEIIIQNKYSTQDCIKFGETLAKIDIEKGNRRVLASTGPFTTGCMTCINYSAQTMPVIPEQSVPLFQRTIGLQRYYIFLHFLS